MEPLRILFVCLGNICRSPLAQGIFESLVDKAGLGDRIKVESAGLGAWHVNEPPDIRMQRTALRHGISLAHQRAQQLTHEDLDDFDLIYAMDMTVEQDIKKMGREETHRDKVQHFSSYDPDPHTFDVPDPFFLEEPKFEYVYNIVDRTCRVILDELKREYDL